MLLRHPGSTLATLCLLAAATLTPAYATVTFTPGNNPQPNEENILLNKGETGTTVTGVTNHTNTVVDFSSTTDTLTEPASGQARIEALDGAINNIAITLPGAGTYGDLIINPFLGNSLPSGSATVTVVTNDGSFPFVYTLGNGNNFLTITTGGGEMISSTTIDSASGFHDLRQPRISGISGGVVVPEPGTLALLIGVGLSGSAFTFRKRRR